MQPTTSKYEQRGVSATKDEVHAAIKHLDQGLFPSAFCKILPDIVGGDPDFCNIMHADTAGTKTSLAYLYWKETGDLSVWKGIAQDAIVMNLDDMACVGCLDQIVLSSTIGRNKNLIPGEVIKAIIDGCSEFLDKLHGHDIVVTLAGGETADVGDIVRTIDVGYTTFARMKRGDLVVNDIRPGDVIVGMASFGQTNYETEYNGGMGSNGLTSARHDVLNRTYGQAYPDSCDPNTDVQYQYSGPHSLLDKVQIGDTEVTVGKLLLSPTRTYLPVLQKIIGQLEIHGLIHCTGGAQTKVLNYVEGVEVIKDQLFPLPPLFELIQNSSATDWKEMYQVFNMGHRMEVYLPESEAQQCIEICKGFNLDAQIVGRVVPAEEKKVTIRSEYGEFSYSPKA